LWEHRAEIRVRHDIVAHGDVAAGIPAQQVLQVGERPVCGPGTKFHALTIQAAERAVSFLSPPATSARFPRQPDLRSIQIRKEPPQLCKVLGEIRPWYRVQIARWRAALDLVNRTLPVVQDRFEELREGILCLAGENKIDRSAERGYPLRHITFAIGTAQDRHRIWLAGFQRTENRDARQGLFKCRAAADDLEAAACATKGNFSAKRGSPGFGCLERLRIEALRSRERPG
jgi:hypothetical protein